ncbi:tyrosine-type recombinase/integrase [Rhodococcus sp. NPDC057135]|uniref:tyrosine-type recombinase/integrase n=1 Tax=Rhodococcus sp. NPDC057135 TaxID=3346028 RepID=UPI0036448C05
MRTINLSDQAIAAMGELKGRNPSEYVFVNKRGTPIAAQLFHNKAWRPTIVQLSDKLGKQPRPHDLRHSCASWMIAAGVPLPVIQQHLGHESITTTIGIYGHLDRRSAQAILGALTAALEGL